MSSKILKPGFLALIVTQFFGAANDNILKMVLTFMVVDGVWKESLGEGGQGIVGVCFTLPFILLSGYAGQLADRYSKSLMSKTVKLAELPIALIGMIGFWTDNLWITMLSLVALTCQSAFFGPAKYGMIPELVDSGDLSRANGVINMMTNIAVIVGTLAGGYVKDHYAPPADAETAVAAAGLPWLPGVTMVGVAVLGIISSLFLGRLPAMEREHHAFEWNPFATYIRSIREMLQTRLFMVMMAWGYFYMLAAIALLIIPEYTKILSVPSFAASQLMGVLGIAVGVGCALAGWISGHRIEPRLIPLGAVGLTVFFVLLGMQPTRELPAGSSILLTREALFILLAGISAGFYIIPLQALLQKLSPADERGRFLGTANAVSFGFMTLSSVIYYFIGPTFKAHPQQIFYVCGGLMAVGLAFFLFRLRGSGIMWGRPSEAAQ